MTDTVLILAWLVFAHLVADFVLQNDWIALQQGHRRADRLVGALRSHGFHVGPVPGADGARVRAAGPVVYAAIVVVTHMLVDRWKVQATRRAERSALDGRPQALPGPRRRAGVRPGQRLDAVARDAVHRGPGAPPADRDPRLADPAPRLRRSCRGSSDLVGHGARATWDPAMVHAVVLTGVVLISLFLVNTRGRATTSSLALVSPRELPDDSSPPDRGGPLRPPARRPSGALAGYTRAASGRSSRPPKPGVAPTGRTRRQPRPPTPRTGARGRDRQPAVPSGAPARIGATIGALERLLIVGFVLVSAEAAVGFVIAAKTIARFKQLDDRGFAEYYLLGTLASVAVAFSSAIIAKAVLETIP